MPDVLFVRLCAWRRWPHKYSIDVLGSKNGGLNFPEEDYPDGARTRN